MASRDISSLFRNSLWVTLGQLGTSLTAFIVITVLANIVSKEVLGEYRYVLALITILGISTLPGLDTALVQSTAKGFTGQLEKMIHIKRRWGLLGLLGGFVTAGYFLFMGYEIRAIGIFFASLAIPLYGTYFVYFFYLQGKKLFYLSALLQLISRIFFACVVLFVAWFFPEPIYLILSFLGATICTQFFAYKYIQRKFIESKNEDPEIVAYGKHLTLLGSLNILVGNVDKILVGTFLGIVPLALYTIATLLPLESIRAGRIIAQVALPTFSSDNRSLGMWKLLPRLIMLEIILFIGWLIYALMSPFFYGLFFPQYIEVVPYTVVAMLIVLTAPSYVLRSLFVARKFKKGINVTLVSVPILKTIILIIGLFGWGLWGTIWALVIGGFFELMIHVWMYHRYTKLDV